jgi:hypothetical protein
MRANCERLLARIVDYKAELARFEKDVACGKILKKTIGESCIAVAESHSERKSIRYYPVSGGVRSFKKEIFSGKGTRQDGDEYGNGYDMKFDKDGHLISTESCEPGACKEEGAWFYPSGMLRLYVLEADNENAKSYAAKWDAKGRLIDEGLNVNIY